MAQIDTELLMRSTYENRENWTRVDVAVQFGLHEWAADQWGWAISGPGYGQNGMADTEDEAFEGMIAALRDIRHSAIRPGSPDPAA